MTKGTKGRGQHGPEQHALMLVNAEDIINRDTHAAFRIRVNLDNMDKVHEFSRDLYLNALRRRRAEKPRGHRGVEAHIRGAGTSKQEIEAATDAVESVYAGTKSVQLAWSAADAISRYRGRLEHPDYPIVVAKVISEAAAESPQILKSFIPGLLEFSIRPRTAVTPEMTDDALEDAIRTELAKSSA